MCGIAGIIYRQRSGPIGADLARMLQAMKHRGPTRPGTRSTGSRATCW